MLECIYFFKLVFFSPLQIIPRHRIAGSYGSPVFNFLRKLHTLFHSGCTSSLPTSSALRAPLLHVPPAVGTACLCDDGTGRCEAPLPLFAHCPHCCAQADNPRWGAFPRAHFFLACASPLPLGLWRCHVSALMPLYPLALSEFHIHCVYYYLMCQVFIAHSLFHPRISSPMAGLPGPQTASYMAGVRHIFEWMKAWICRVIKNYVMCEKYLFSYDHLSFYFYCFLYKNDTFMASEFPILLKIFLHISWGYLYFVLDYLLKSFKRIYPIWNSFSALCKAAFVFFSHQRTSSEQSHSLAVILPQRFRALALACISSSRPSGPVPDLLFCTTGLSCLSLGQPQTCRNTLTL